MIIQTLQSYLQNDSLQYIIALIFCRIGSANACPGVLALAAPVPPDPYTLICIVGKDDGSVKILTASLQVRPSSVEVLYHTSLSPFFSYLALVIAAGIVE